MYPVQAALTNANFFAYATTITLIIPVMLVAILVDASKPAARIGPISANELPDRTVVRHSRRTLLGVTIAVVSELSGLYAVLTIPNNDTSGVAPGTYIFVLETLAGIFVLFYVLLAPHFELHISNIRKDPGTARWSLLVGWAVDLALIATAVELQFTPQSRIGHYLVYVYLFLGLILTGSMITLTAIVVRGNMLTAPPKEGPEAELRH